MDEDLDAKIDDTALPDYGVPSAGIYSIVTTTRAKYFGIVSESKKGIVIDSAYDMDGDALDPHKIAREYVRGALYGENRRIELSDSLVESVTEAPDESRIVNTLLALVPEAKRRAIGIMTYKALEDILSK